MLQDLTGINVPTKALFDIQIKRIHEYKRQHLNMFSVINRYLDIKEMSPEEKKKVRHFASLKADLYSYAYLKSH